MTSASELLPKVLGGDRSAFDSLVRLESRRLYGIAYQVTRDQAAAEDVVQTVFFRVFEGQAPYRGAGSADAWLKRITVRLAIDFLRRREARVRREEIAHAVSSRQGVPEAGEQVAEREALVCLGEALGALPLETRAALWLHVAEGQGVREVARALGMSKSTVSRRVDEGLQRLRAILARAGFALPIAVAAIAERFTALPSPSPTPAFLAEIRSLAPGLRPAPSRPGARLPRAAWPLAAAALLVVAGAYLGLRALTGNPGGPVQVVARDGAAARGAAVEAPAPTAEPAPAATPAVEANRAAAGHRIEGVVLDPAGRPRGGVEVLAHEDFARRDLHRFLDAWELVDLGLALLDGVEPYATTMSDESGRFVLELAEPRPVLLAAFQHGDSPACGEARTEAPAPRPVELRLAPATELRGSISSTSGAPLAGAGVLLVPSLAAPLDRDFTSTDLAFILESYVPRQATTDAAGGFVLPPAPLGDGEEYELVAWHPGHGAVRRPLAGTAPEELAIRLEPSATLPGLASVAPSGAPASGARIVGIGGDWFGLGIADERGRFTLELPRGLQAIEVLGKLPGRVEPARVSWRREGGSPLLEVMFATGGSISGQVRFASSGAPAPAARVLCRSHEGALVSAETRTDAAGAYELAALPTEGGRELLVVLPGFVPVKSAAVWPTSESPRVVHDIDLMPTLTVHGSIVGPDGEGIPDARVEVVAATDDDAEGMRLRWRQEVVGWKETRTDAAGGYRVADVYPTGKIFVWAYHPRLGEAFSDFTPVPVGGDTEQRIDVRLEPGKLELRVEEAAGKAIEGIHTQIISMSIWDRLPNNMNLHEWFRYRTSMDRPLIQRQLGLVPGVRSGVLDGEGGRTWEDLIADKYQVSIDKSLREGRLTIWEQEYWLYMGTTAAPLGGTKLTTVRFRLDLSRTVKGRCRAPKGAELPPLRVQVWYRPQIPGLEDALGYTVTHTREDGSFEAVAVGPGPYRLTVQDVKDRIVELRGVPEGQEVDVLYDLTATKPKGAQ